MNELLTAQVGSWITKSITCVSIRVVGCVACIGRGIKGLHECVTKTLQACNGALLILDCLNQGRVLVFQSGVLLCDGLCVVREGRVMVCVWWGYHRTSYLLLLSLYLLLCLMQLAFQGSNMGTQAGGLLLGMGHMCLE